MHKKRLKFTARMLSLTLLALLLIVPTVSAQSNTPLLASAQGTAWGIGTPNETAIIHLQVTNLYVDPARNSTISPWVLEFDFEGDIQSVTNAVISSKVGNHYTLKGTDDTDLAYGDTLNLKLRTTLNGKSSATFNSITLRPEFIANPWKHLNSYKVNDIVEYNGLYYKAIQAHTAYATNWTPALTPALWQPTSIETYSYSTSAEVELLIIESWALLGTYTAGQIVYYDGQFYRCVQSHTAHAPNWNPGPQTEALWTKVELDL